jgi:hypothetical protein
MSVSSGEKPSSERPVEIGPPGGDGARAPLPSLARTEEERGRTSGSGLPGEQPPLTASYSEAEAMSRKIRERFEQS